MTRAEIHAREGIEQEAAQRANWARTLTQQGRKTPPRAVDRAEWVRLGVFYALAFAMLWPWLRVLRALAELLRGVMS